MNKALSISDVIYNNNTMCASIIPVQQQQINDAAQPTGTDDQVESTL